MNKKLLLILFAVLCGKVSIGQLIGTDIFLQGAYLEIGQQDNGAFGTCSIPAGYHPHTFGGGGSNLAEVYDYGHDGWTIGTPPFMGDYTYPGSPFEGWELQVGTGRTQAFQSCWGGLYTTGGTGTGLTGRNVSYSNTGGRIIGNWEGNAVAGSLRIFQETRVDTLASAVVVTTRFYNTSATAIPGVYYMRSCDPDNDQSWPGGGFFTNNTIVHQNEDATHRVQVKALGVTGAHTYMALGTKDCRAKCFIYDSWWLSSSVDLSSCWTGTYGPATYNLGGTRNGDIAIALVYNIGTIAPSDSAIISYAYIYNGDAGIEDAFPDPLLRVNGSVVTTYPDTFDVCLYPGMTTLPVDILNGDDKCWSWSDWTWEPSLGLSSTTGTGTRDIDLTVIPGDFTYTVTGNDSNANMFSCNRKTFIFTVHTCHDAFNNSPCYGDSLKFRMLGDSIGATYFWYGPTGFTSTMHNPFKYPALYSDSGLYHVVRTIAGVRDTDSTYVLIRTKPDLTISSNSPLCEGAFDTLELGVTPYLPGITFDWIGPNSFTSTLQFPRVYNFSYPDTVSAYRVIGITSFGCKDTAFSRARLIPIPRPPVIVGYTPYCQGETFRPFTVDSVNVGGTVLWYPGMTGGTGTTTPSVVNTAIPGYTTVYASQRTGSCEGPRDTFTVRVKVTPPVPVVAGRMAYCQFIGPSVPLTVTTSTGAIALWYTTATGGTGSTTQPTPNLNVAGPKNYWVSQVLEGCEGPRLPVVIMINPKPAPPAVTNQNPCEGDVQTAAVATPLAGHALTWYGPGIAGTGSPVAPVPPTTPVGVDTYFVTQTSTFGCISDSASLFVTVKPVPGRPRVLDTSLCQGFKASALTATGNPGSTLNWYLGGILLPGAPTPALTVPGDSVWQVSQTVNGCEGDKANIKVRTIYTPKFDISPKNPWLCQKDSIILEFNGAALVDPIYSWVLPEGAVLIGGTRYNGEQIKVRFDSATMDNYVYLTAFNEGGRCFSIDTIRVRIVPQPIATSFSKRDVCLGDTVNLAIGVRSDNATNFVWKIDNTPMATATAINIIAHNSNSGGPFSISWNDSGTHVIQVNVSTKEGCKSESAFDTIRVHTLPDARFDITTHAGTLCIEDSVYFTAVTVNYANLYTWEPARAFRNINKAQIWGIVEGENSVITLRVTDPFGCTASEDRTITPNTCCTVTFPNAFSPNGDGRNEVFRPIFQGFHRFHTFRIVNRWGQTVFESTNSDMAWDGSYNGVPQDMGVYYYYIKYDCGTKNVSGLLNTIEEEGDVTLVR